MQSRLSRFLPIAVVLFAAVYFFLKIMASPYSESSDTLSLFNPVYMEHFYGKMAYPAYNLFDNMVIHPPLNYKLIAFFYQLGFNLQMSMMLPLFLAILLVFALVALSDIEFGWKVAFVLAIVVVSSFTFSSLSIRPDYLLSICWFGGLMCLENARIKNWNGKWLVAGAGLLSISSTLHYFGSFAFLGLVPYLIKIYRERDGGFFKRKAFLAIVPVFLLTGSYFFFQVLPNIKDVASQIFATYQIHQTGSVQKHFEVYQYFFNGYFFQKLLIVPVCAAAFLLLLIKSQTRLLAFAGLPVTFFVLFFSSGKSGGYFIPEFLILVFGLLLWLYQGLKNLYHVFFKANILLFNATATIACCFYMAERMDDVCISIYHHYPSVLKAAVRNNEMITMRACSQYILGDNPKTASRMDLWFVSGGSSWVNLMPDVIQKDKIQIDSLRNYFSSFDAIAEHAHMANNTLRKDNATINSLYLAGRFKLRAFYLTNNYSSPPNSNALPLLFYSIESRNRVAGFSCLNNQKLRYYEQDSVQSDYYLITAIVGKEYENHPFLNSFDFCNLMPLPDKRGQLYQMASNVKQYLFWGIVSKQKAEVVFADITKFASMKECIPLHSKEVALRDVLTHFKPEIRFYYSYENFTTGKTAFDKPDSE